MTRIYTEKIVQEHRRVLTSVKCDVCGNIDSSGDEIPYGWHEMNHHHEGWGNDSVDSFDKILVCSVNCFTIQLEKSIEEVGEYKGASICGMTETFAENLLQKLKGNMK